MQRIEKTSLETAPEDSKPILEKVNGKYGKVPNIFATVAHSPAALKAMAAQFEALGSGSLHGKPHEAIALYVGEIHGCRYCTAAHTAKAKMAGASEEETILFRQGKATEPKLQAMLDLAGAITRKRGQIDDADVQAARDAGVSEGEMIETVAIISLNCFTNYINGLVLTDVDFPAAPPLPANAGS